jgi:hypothetical protein
MCIPYYGRAVVCLPENSRSAGFLKCSGGLFLARRHDTERPSEPLTLSTNNFLSHSDLPQSPKKSLGCKLTRDQMPAPLHRCTNAPLFLHFRIPFFFNTFSNLRVSRFSIRHPSFSVFIITAFLSIASTLIFLILSSSPTLPLVWHF